MIFLAPFFVVLIVLFDLLVLLAVLLPFLVLGSTLLAFCFKRTRRFGVAVLGFSLAGACASTLLFFLWTLFFGEGPLLRSAWPYLFWAVPGYSVAGIAGGFLSSGVQVILWPLKYLKRITL